MRHQRCLLSAILLLATAATFPARADVWLAAQDHVSRYATTGEIVATISDPYGVPFNIQRGVNLISVNPRDGTVWVADYGGTTVSCC